MTEASDPLDFTETYLQQMRLVVRKVELDALRLFGDTAASTFTHEAHRDALMGSVVHDFEVMVLADHLEDKTYNTSVMVPATWVDHLMIEHDGAWWVRLLAKVRGEAGVRVESRQVTCRHDAIYPRADLGAIQRLGQPVLVAHRTL